jgi:hypothetical protein
LRENLATTDLDQAHPTPYRSHRDRVVWRLDEPVDIGDELLEVTLVDRRVRDIFDLTPDILALAGGLLLGLASQQLASTRTSAQRVDPSQTLSNLDARIRGIEHTGRAIEERWKRIERRTWVFIGITLLMASTKRKR